MSGIYSYLLKLSLCLSVVYLFYQLFLRRLTFYNWNRWYLLGYTAIAFVIPFIRINPVLEKSQLHANEMLEYIPVVGYSGAGVGQVATDSTWTYEEWILLAISIGIAIMLVRLLVQHISLNRMKKQSELLLDDSVRLYQVNKNIIPFSFGNTIFVNQHQHSQEELKEIIRHEFIHVKQRHTVDILWSEILCILNWYNPFVWLLRFAIRQNLEFIADYKVLENGLDKKEYQYLLLKVIGVSQFSIATKFNFTSLKKRIAMMNKMKSAKVHLLKFLFILPLLAVLLLSFRDKFSSDTSQRDPYVRYEGLVFDIDTKQPISDVTILDQQSGKTAVSDKNGRYSFEFDKDSKKLHVFMVFNKSGYVKQEAAFFLEFKTDKENSTGLMELVGMKQGKTGDKCDDCFSSISMKYENAPDQITEEDLFVWLKERTKNSNALTINAQYSDWKLNGVNFKAESFYISDDKDFIKIVGVKDFNYTEPNPKGMVVYKKKEYSLHDFAVAHGFQKFNTVYLFQGKTAFERYGNKGRHGVMYVVDPVLQDTIPTPAQAPVGVKSPGLPKGVRSININQDIATVKLENGTKEKYDLRVPAEKAAYIKKYGEIPTPPPPPPAPKASAALPTPPAPPTNNIGVSTPAPAAAPTAPTPPAPPTPSAKGSAAHLPGANQWEQAAPNNQGVNKKGYILSVADNNGECIVIIKDRNRKIVKSVLLEDWNKDEKANTEKYGAIPPPPPPLAPANGLPAPGADQGIITAPPAGYAFEQGPKKYNPANPHPENIRLTNLTKVSVEAQPLIILDGIEQANVAVINNLDPVEIESISILKDASSMELYGIKGKNGVILISTKENKKGASAKGKKSTVSMKEATMATTDSKVTIKPKDVFKGIYVVNGKEYSPAEFEALQIDPHTIESINILKGEKATEAYGDKGKEGVIVVKTK